MTQSGSPGLSAAEKDFQASFRKAVREAREASLEDAGLLHQGIVIPAGGARMFTCAWVAVRMLRDYLGSKLPIQIWHIGPGEMSPAMSALLAGQQVETVDARQYADEGVQLGGFELKSLALLKCSFRKVVLLDADNVPLIDPGVLFEDAAFRDTGAIFWPDLVSIAASSRIWELCGVGYRSMPSFESGQLAIDRVRHYPALALSWFMNQNSRLVYQHVYGDKDCFLMAWLALGHSFHLVRHGARRLYGCICQHHPDGRRMFQHRNLRKWKLFGENLAISGFTAEEACLRYLAELRTVWNGRIFHPPACDDEMRTIAEGLTAQRHFRLETVSIGVEHVEFHQHNLLIRNTGTVGTWWLARESRTVVLELGDDHVVSRRFLCSGPNDWRSAPPSSDAQELILTAENDPSALAPEGHNTQSVLSSLKNWQRNYESVKDATWTP